MHGVMATKILAFSEVCRTRDQPLGRFDDVEVVEKHTEHNLGGQMLSGGEASAAGRRGNGQ